MASDYNTALTIAQALLRGKHPPTIEDIDLAVTRAELVIGRAGLDLDALRRDLEVRSNIWIGSASSLDDKEGHVPWLDRRRSEIQWHYWHRYERLLEEVKHFAPATVGRLGQLSEEVLGRLEDPDRRGPWDRRGLVVGQVQSGKTSNYSGLIAKAADAGYRLIVVLAGRTNSLRSQTQLRLDESFLGYDTRYFFDEFSSGENARTRRVGVGTFGVSDGNEQWPMSGTNSEERGDFNRSIAQKFGIVPNSSGMPLLLVVKKNVSVLRNLVRWATGVAGQDDAERGVRVVRDVPLLVIDDEADDASVNTRPLTDENGEVLEDQDPTETNRQIRRLLHSFDKAAYVGYTATPFANIFIHPSVDSQGLGRDLFPRHFIINLPAPSNYVGPGRVFGLEAGPSGLFETKPGLPVIRSVDDHDEWLPDRHNKNHLVGNMPESLQEAVRAFILSCASRLARGHVSKHNSMLVHVTRFTNVQRQIAEQIREELTLLQRRLRLGDGSSPYDLREELRELWEKDYEDTSDEIRRLEPELGYDLLPVRWSDVDRYLWEAAERIRVKTINGSANDSLEYWNHPDGLSVIAVGGDKLSRGLTLEGLAVSYYLRGSRMYDTLMQMGRWFGYRDGYLDLCRLYTTDALSSWYRYITLASEELRLEFQAMAEQGMSPEDFGLRVLTHPSGLKITQAGKMRESETVRVAFGSQLAESLTLHTSQEIREENFATVARLVAKLVELGGKPEAPRGRHDYLWSGVPGSRIATFLGMLNTHPASQLADGPRLGSFIRAQMSKGELTEWAVLLVSSSTAKRSLTIGGVTVGLTYRAGTTGGDVAGFSVDRLLSPEHEAADLDDDAFARALAATRARRGKNERPGSDRTISAPAGIDARGQRSSKNGLLILYPLDNPDDEEAVLVGFGVSFPGSRTARPVEYQVNEVYRVRQLELGL